MPHTQDIEAAASFRRTDRRPALRAPNAYSGSATVYAGGLYTEVKQRSREVGRYAPSPSAV
jgi:hypothetical protein